MNTSDQRGFTLLEVLVALVILILAIDAFYQAFGSGLQAEAAADRERRSAEIAANLLAELGHSQMLQDGLTNGELPNGYRWTLRVESFTPTDLDGQAPMIDGHLATLTVKETGRGGGALRIQTLVLGSASQ